MTSQRDLRWRNVRPLMASLMLARRQSPMGFTASDHPDFTETMRQVDAMQITAACTTDEDERSVLHQAIARHQAAVRSYADEAADLYRGIDFHPPRAVSSAARAGLRWAGGSGLEISRATRLAAGQPISPAELRRLAEEPVSVIAGGEVAQAWYRDMVDQLLRADSRKA